MSPSPLEGTLKTLDRTLVRAARSVRVLGTLTWPASVEAPFLAAWRKGAPILPEPPPLEIDDLDPLEAPLEHVARRADPEHPAGAFLVRTARGYLRALELLRTAGTPRFAEVSLELFGGPEDRIVRGAPSPLEEAEHLIEAAGSMACDPEDGTLSAEEAATRLEQMAAPHFDEPLPVQLDPALGSLAAAGSKRVRLRDGVRYTEAQLEQLLQHEALVHSATKRNGRNQRWLRSLGLSSPRTAATQEGLATLAELITDTIDLLRLKRVALRVKAVHAALQGADFLDVFRLLLEAGQPEVEAYRSTMRVFRGGDVRGGVAFTKDVVYLSGLREVHTFLLAAMREHRHDLPVTLFVGRLTPGDAVALAPLVQSGLLQPPAVVPPWVARRDHLAANLTWTEFGHRIPLDRIALSDFEPT
ncbi:MAG: flavohemoglobin expression-modulating QEGLA motif protein [Myxococcales bacterium]|nr:flavohemoglobin expression-modulating QEGLA motif protein [Myxococcales bacterium]